jgi:hypothetical protein
LGHTFHNVKKDNVTQLFQSNEVSESAANVTCSNERNLIPGHNGKAPNILRDQASDRMPSLFPLTNSIPPN